MTMDEVYSKFLYGDARILIEGARVIASMLEENGGEVAHQDDLPEENGVDQPWR